MRRTIHLHLPLLFLLGLLLVPAPSTADDSDASPLQGQALLKRGQAREEQGKDLYQNGEFTAAATSFTEAAVDGINALDMMDGREAFDTCVRMVMSNLGYAQQCREKTGPPNNQHADINIETIKQRMDSGMTHLRNGGTRPAMDSFTEGCTLAAQAMYGAASEEDRFEAYTLFKFGFEKMMEIQGRN